jgi:hypothetical protein
MSDGTPPVRGSSATDRTYADQADLADDADRADGVDRAEQLARLQTAVAGLAREVEAM